jgi:berberine-like enzyme
LITVTEEAKALIGAIPSPEDWERLVELKDRYDSENLFGFNRNIPASSAVR